MALSSQASTSVWVAAAGGAAVVEPGEELDGGQDAAACRAGGVGREGLAAGSSACPAQDVPGRERPDEGGVGWRAGREALGEPRLDAVEVLVRSGSTPAWTRSWRRWCRLGVC